MVDLALQPRGDAIAGDDDEGSIKGEETRYSLTLPNDETARSIGMADLQRWKRQFLAINRNLATVGNTATTTTTTAAAETVEIDHAKRLFCDFLASRLSDE